ncbi:hypothetical protein JCM3774_000520 [Rhodotorula dairenensis]
MPQSRYARPAAAATADYFDSLADLATWARTPRPPHDEYSAAPPAPLPAPLLRDEDPHRGKVLVCHDYKGGYSECNGDERVYTFEHFRSIDTFVYFSHHRVTCPPKSWIRAAHAAGTAILGTLIFEWDAGKADIVELVTADESDRFRTVNTRYADMLVALTRERGFDGWLVNVEVDLGIGSANDAAGEHAAALVAWLTYFSAALKRAVPSAQVLWYDAVTSEGKLRWQNCLNELNFPFFQACDGIFCNYWWRQEHLESTRAFIEKAAPGRQNDVYFGIDIFGRGTYAGGGFETWRAMHAIREATPAGSASFSTALFAPGWTVEAESMQHSLTTSEAHQRWRADDRYLWQGGQPTPSVATEAARQTRERMQQRGVARARQLAALTDPTASPVPLRSRAPIPATFDYNGPLPPLPGSDVALSRQNLISHCPPPRAIPCPDFHFYTNFSAGSGHAFFVAGQKVVGGGAHGSSSEAGWTDMDFLTPQPLLHDSGTLGFDEDDAWEGERCLVVAPHSSAIATSPRHASDPRSELFDLAIPPSSTQIDVDLLLVYKTTTTRDEPAGAPRLYADGKRVQPAEYSGPTMQELANGWRLSRAQCHLRPYSEASTLFISLRNDTGTLYRVGAICIVRTGH